MANWSHLFCQPELTENILLHDDEILRGDAAFFVALAHKPFHACLRRHFGSQRARRPFATPVSAVACSLERFLYVAGSPRRPPWLSRWDEKTASHLAASGDVGVMREARSRQLPWDSETFTAAATHGHMALLDYLWEEECPVNLFRWWTPSPTIARVVKANRVEVLGWIHRKGFGKWRKALCVIAAEEGALDALRWLSETAQLPLETRALNRAAINGHHDVVEWLHHVAKPTGAELCPLFVPSTSYGAALHGRLATLQWMDREGYPWDRVDCLNAASIGGWYATAEWIYDQIDPAQVPHQKMIDDVNGAKRGRRRRRGRGLELDHGRIIDMLRRGMMD